MFLFRLIIERVLNKVFFHMILISLFQTLLWHFSAEPEMSSTTFWVIFTVISLLCSGLCWDVWKVTNSAALVQKNYLNSLRPALCLKLQNTIKGYGICLLCLILLPSIANHYLR